MNRTLCFHIENKNLYLEQVLIDYNHIPIFFLCKDERQYYLALCIDIEEFNYIIVTLSVSELSNLLHGNIPMRDIFLKKDYYWEVISNEDIFSDTVTKHKINQLIYSLLPKENVYFQVLTEEVETFIQKLDILMKV